MPDHAITGTDTCDQVPFYNLKIKSKLTDPLSERLEDNFRQLEEGLEKLFLEPLEDALSVVEKTLSYRVREGKKKPPAGELVAAMAEIEGLLNDFTGRWFPATDAFPIVELLKSYNSSLEKIISQEDKSIRKVQASERFLPPCCRSFQGQGRQNPEKNTLSGQKGI